MTSRRLYTGGAIVVIGVEKKMQPGSHQIDIMRVALEPEAIRRIPRSLALRHDVLSLSTDDNQLVVALPEESAADTVDRVRLATGMHVRVVHAPRDQIRARIESAYPSDSVRRDAPAAASISSIHAQALAVGASDIHLEPCAAGGRVRQRVDGVLVQTQVVDKELFGQIISRLKVLSGMDIADRRQPQDGRYCIDGLERIVDARVSSLPTIDGEKLAIRLLDLDGIVPSLESIGLPHALQREVRRACSLRHGMMVVCGPTGSGKTTTLYAALAELDPASQNLCTVEDPVEIRMAGVTQVQINAKAGITFASSLRALLRQDPDAVMIGEMRDEETAAIAASASLTGQLVLTSVHSVDALAAIERLVELGIPRRTLAAGLSCILAQRLVPLLCRDCRQTSQAVFHSPGCDRCGGAGQRGRTAVFEMLMLTPALRQAICEGASTTVLQREAQASGYVRMLTHGRDRVARGEISADALARALSESDD